MPQPKAPHHRGTYHVRAAKLRAAAYANPNTRCWRCGLTLEQIRKLRPRIKWQAGHVIAGQVDGTLLPECSWCNAKHGQALSAASRRARRHAPQPARVTDLTW